MTANATDNLGVYGVQFKLDGAILGAEDLVAPYSTDWNTAAATSGSHTLTAVGRDVAGNETTAASVTVTVSNAGPKRSVGHRAVGGPVQLAAGFDSLDASADRQGASLRRPHDDRRRANLGSRHRLADVAAVQRQQPLLLGTHPPARRAASSWSAGILAPTWGSRTRRCSNPTNETWSPAATMSQARWYPTATSLPDGRVLALSGASDCPTCNNPSGSHTGIALIPEIYDPRTNTWSRLTNASLSLPLYPHIFVLPDGRILATSTHEDPIVTRALDIGTQTWTVVDPVVRDGGKRRDVPPRKILKTGMGRNPDYAAAPSTATAYVMDTNLPSPTWRAIAPMTFSRTQHNLTVLPDGNVFAVGGSTNSDVYDTAGTVKTAELWSPATETWRTLATMQEPRHYHSTSLLLPDGRVLVAGAAGSVPTSRRPRSTRRRTSSRDRVRRSPRRRR